MTQICQKNDKEGTETMERTDRLKGIGYRNQQLVDNALMSIAETTRNLTTINKSADRDVRRQALCDALLNLSIAKDSLKDIKRGESCDREM